MKKMINKIRESIQAKLQLFVLSSASVVFFVTIFYVSFQNRQLALIDAKRLTKEIAQKKAADIESELNKDYALTQTLALSLQDFVLYTDSVRNQVVPTMLKRVFEKHTHLHSIWIHWELAAVVDGYEKSYGRVRKNFFRENAGINFKIDTVDTDGDKEQGLYYQIKVNKVSMITEPYWYSYMGKSDDAVLETSICVPVLQSTRFTGLMGIDLKLDRFAPLVKSINPYPNSYAFFVSNNGFFIYHPDSKVVGTNLIVDNAKENEKYRFDFHMRNGKPFSFVRDIKGEDYFVTFAPVKIGDTDTPWFLSIVVPYQEMVAIANKNLLSSLLIGLVGILILGIVLWLIARRIIRPLINISALLKELAHGRINTDSELTIYTKDEVGAIAIDVNGLKQSLSSTAMFASEIGKGNLEADFEKLSDEDVLGNALLDMRQSLQKAREQEIIRQQADDIQKWIASGLAKVNEIMRQHNELHTLAYAVIKFIVDSLEANQGAFYVLADIEENVPEEEHEFEVVTALAWGRKKSVKKKMKMGETLVGRAAYERTVLYLTDIPDDYVNITSGLGKANPRCLLIVPMILNDEVLGVLEIVSFNAMEDYQREFVEKAGESIASTIASLKISQRTALLLDQTKNQAGELTEKEEELRQQMEEMQATQEEAAKREAEMSGMITAINSIAYVAEYDMDGQITEVNNAYAQLLEMSRHQIIGKRQGFFVVGEDNDRVQLFEQLWAKMRKGIPHKQEQEIGINNEKRWLSEVYTPILDLDGNPVRVINIAMDITHLKD